jgi:hypothetical protein
MAQYIEITNIGNKFYYKDKKMTKLHREDGPAVEYASGAKFWFRDGKRHREDGPAIEHADGSKEWYRDGKRHREDGPAIEWSDGSKFWYWDGKRLAEAKFLELIQPAREMTVAEIEKLLGHKVKVVKE